MKRLFLLLNIILAISISNAQETYRLRTDAPQGLSIERSTPTGLSLHYSVPEIGIANINNGEAKGQEIILKGSFGSFAEGMPNLPFENRYIAVPKGATVSIEVKERASKTLNGIELLPAAEVQLNTDKGLPKLRKDMNVFGKDANFPSENVTIAQTTQIRNLDVVLLNVTPFRYNPVRKTLEVIYDMDIEVRFEGGNGQFGDLRYRNPDWDNILRDLVINSDMLPEAHYYDRLNEAIQNREEGCEYLIIAPDDDSILAWADTLRAFRTEQGIPTKVVTTTECGGNEPDSIKGYIKNAYENWAIPPAAVMIFSGPQYIYGQNTLAEGICACPLTFYGYQYSNGQIVDYDYHTDNLFVDMNGDSIPDIAVSRLAAYDLDQYKNQVEKVINFETNPPTAPQYYDHPIITSGYEYNKWFMITSQAFNGFCSNKLGKHPTNLYMVYDFDEYVLPDSAWSTGYNTDAPVNYFGPDGQNYFPRYICELNHWVSTQDGNMLINAFRDESFFTLYRDHSSYSLWCCPSFESHRIPLLKNTLPTYIFSIGCDTGCFDAYYSYTQNNLLPCFCNAPVGALGGIGATTVTRSHFNDILTWGMIDYIWPDFMPTLGSSGNSGFVRPTYGLVAGKLFVNQHVFMPNWWPTWISETCNVFHSLGDAYLNLYTETPQPIAIDASFYHPDNQWEYTFTAEEGTLVCLSKDDEILMVAQGTGEPQSVTLPQMVVGEQFTITATKQNCFRFKKEVTVIPSTQPYVYLNQLRWEGQDENDQIDYGENIWMALNLHNAGLLASDGGDITLHCESPYIEILKGTAHYSHLDSEEKVVIEKAFNFKVANDIPDQTELTFKLRFNESESSREELIFTKANAPILRFRPEFSITDAEGRPSTHILTEGNSYLTFTIENIGNSKTHPLGTSLDIKAPFVTPSAHVSEGIGEHSSRRVTFPIVLNGSESRGAWLQSQLRIQHLDTEIALDTIIQYGAIFEDFESDTLNPVFGWINNSPTPWTYCEDDVFEGQRSFEAYVNDNQSTILSNTASGIYMLNHPFKASFYYKTNRNGTISFNYATYQNVYLHSSDEWKYYEQYMSSRITRWTWRLYNIDRNLANCKIDHICFPPVHRAIAFAGNDVVSCHEAQVELHQAYAYDCDSVLWTTDGDGHFEDASVANPTYYPGNQDLENGFATLTLTAFARDTVVSSTTIHFLDEINLGIIVGDNVVNKYNTPFSHYHIENQYGLDYVWQLEPVEAGTIYSHGNAIDIAWNLHEGDMEATLSVTAENGCYVEPIRMNISLIGTGTEEWHSLNFDLYPNPTNGKVNLVLSENLQGKAIIEVYNLLGERMLYQNASQLRQGETISLDLSKLVSGLYIIKLSTENGSCSKKVSVR